MGWRNNLISLADKLHATSGVVRKLVSDDGRDVEGNIDLDDVVLELLNAQHHALEALSEIYDSCGPFFPPPKSKAKAKEEIKHCRICDSSYVVDESKLCPVCGTQAS